MGHWLWPIGHPCSLWASSRHLQLSPTGSPRGSGRGAPAAGEPGHMASFCSAVRSGGSAAGQTPARSNPEPLLTLSRVLWDPLPFYARANGGPRRLGETWVRVLASASGSGGFCSSVGTGLPPDGTFTQAGWVCGCSLLTFTGCGQTLLGWGTSVTEPASTVTEASAGKLTERRFYLLF